MKEYDAFISHASEDKDGLVRDIANQLQNMGFNIWYDETVLSVGSGLRTSIDQGLLNSDFGIVVLSKSFFDKGWTNYELDGLVTLRMENPGRILPLWHEIEKSDVVHYSPSLANIVAISTKSKNTSQIVGEIQKSLGHFTYTADDSGNILKSANRKPIPVAEKKRGFQSIYSRQTDELTSDTESISRSEVILNPFSADFKQYKKHFWQGAKGEMDIVQSVIYDHYSGDIIDFDFSIEKNDGFELSGVYNFENKSCNPLRVLTEMRTTNQLEGIFRLGMDYMDFNNKVDINRFIYRFITPDSGLFDGISVYANDDAIVPERKRGKRFFNHLVTPLRANTELRYNFKNAT